MKNYPSWKEMTDSTGDETIVHFCHCYKEMVGMSPFIENVDPEERRKALVRSIIYLS